MEQMQNIDLSSYIENKVIAVHKKAWDAPKRYLVSMGSAGSGKSVAASQYITLMAMTSQEKFKGLVIRSVKADNAGSTYEEIKTRIQELGWTEFFTFNRSNLEIKHKHNGNTIVFQGLDDIERIKSIANISFIWIEEASEITEHEFKQLDVRLRADREYDLKIFITFNPISATHWLKKRFFDNEDPKAHVIKTTYKDNPYLTQDYIETLEAFKLHSPYYYQVYCLGNWGTIGDTVFDRERIGTRLDQVFNRKHKKGYFEFEYVDQMIVPETIQWVDSKEKAFITIYEEPDDLMPYVLGGDTAGLGIDNFAAHLMNNYTGKIAAQYFSELPEPYNQNLKVTEKQFTDQMYCLGMWYNEAMINLETNYSTYPVLELARMEYPNQYRREVIGTNDGSQTPNRYGFVTGKTNRNSILSLVDQYIKENIEEVDSAELLDELTSFVIVESKSRGRKKTMRQEASQGAHDDLIMALGITLFTRDQHEKHPKVGRRPDWKRSEFDPLNLYSNSGEEGWNPW